MESLKFYAPGTVVEALELVRLFGGQATVLAGGTDVVPRINIRELRPRAIIHIGRLGLSYVRETEGALSLGACTTVAAIARDAAVSRLARMLAEAAGQLGTPAIRTAATIGGNIVNASPAADLVPPLLVLGARVRLLSAASERVVPLCEFFLGSGGTVLAPEEILMEVLIPRTEGRTAFLKLGRRRNATLSVVNVAVWMGLEADKRGGSICRSARLALGSMGPRPLLCQRAPLALVSHVVTRAAIAKCAALAVAESEPVDDIRATASYRRKVANALVRRALMQVAGGEV